MRILFVNEKLGWFGGVEQNIADTAAGLRDRGIECLLAWGEETTRDPAGYTALFAGVDRCSVHGGEGESLEALVRRHRPDVVYFHKVGRLPALEGLPRAVRMVHDHDLCCPRKHKYFAHNAHVCHHPAGWRCWLDLAFLERARGTALGVRFRGLGGHHAEMRRNRALDLCLVGSRFMRDELAMNGFAAHRVEILPPVVRMRAPVVSDAAADPHVLYVGQLIRGKGVDLLLEALARVQQPFRATIIGEGNARPALEAQCAALQLNDRVRFLGWVPNAELGAHYAAARLLAVPARWPEPFGMIGLEAMHHARPVVAFAVGGIPDWLVDGKTGFLVPERDTAAYAAAIDQLLADRDLATRMGRAGLERVHTVYTFEGYLDRLVTLLAGDTP